MGIASRDSGFPTCEWIAGDRRRSRRDAYARHVVPEIEVLLGVARTWSRSDGRPVTDGLGIEAAGSRPCRHSRPYHGFFEVQGRRPRAAGESTTTGKEKTHA